MPFDAHSNLALSAVATAPVPAASGTSLTVAAGTGALFPAVPFNCTIWPTGTNPGPTNAEIIRVTNMAGDVMTIARAQEGTAARSIIVGDLIANTATKKTFTDIETAIVGGVVAASASNGSFAFSTLGFSNANNVTFGTSAGSIITASVAAAGGGAALSAGTQSQNTGTIVFSNSNGMAFGMTNSSIITASYTQAAQAASASNGSFSFQTLGFSNANNITFGTSAGSIITASANAQSTQPVAASASNGSFLFSTLAFSNANGITFGTSAGSIVTASVGAGVAAGSVSAGTTNVALGQIVFSNANNMIFGLNGSTLTASATVAAGVANTLSFWAPRQLITGATNFISLSQNSIQFDPVILPVAVSFTQVRQLGSYNLIANSTAAGDTGRIGYTNAFAIYTRSVTNPGATNFSNSTNLVTMFSTSATYSVLCSMSSQSISLSFGWATGSTDGSTSSSLSTNSAFYNGAPQVGQKFILIGAATSLSAGEYFFAQNASSSTAGVGPASSLFRLLHLEQSIMSNVSWATGWNGATNTSVNAIPGMGAYSVTSAAFPTSIAISEISNPANVFQERYYQLLA